MSGDKTDGDPPVEGDPYPEEGGRRLNVSGLGLSGIRGGFNRKGIDTKIFERRAP
jgi:hypothetical protein